MLFKVISLSIKTGSASFFNSSSGRTALDVCHVPQNSINGCYQKNQLYNNLKKIKWLIAPKVVTPVS